MCGRIVRAAQWIVSCHWSGAYIVRGVHCSNIIYSAATMNLKLDYDLLHLVGKAIGWQIDEFKPQVRSEAALFAI